MKINNIWFEDVRIYNKLLTRKWMHMLESIHYLFYFLSFTGREMER
jgi:hypothetical protein